MKNKGVYTWKDAQNVFYLKVTQILRLIIMEFVMSVDPLKNDGQITTGVEKKESLKILSKSQKQKSGMYSVLIETYPGTPR